MLTILHMNNTTKRYTDFHIYNIKLLLARCSYVIVFISNEKSKPNFAAAAAQNKGQRFTKKKRKESKKNKIVFFC